MTPAELRKEIHSLLLEYGVMETETGVMMRQRILDENLGHRQARNKYSIDDYVQAILSQIRLAVEELENPYGKRLEDRPWVIRSDSPFKYETFESCRQSILKLLGGNL